jgi:hypothetical protein
MPALVADIHVLRQVRDVDGRDEPGHDDAVSHPFNIAHPDFANQGTNRYDFFATGTGTPAIFTLNMPRLVRVQK